MKSKYKYDEILDFFNFSKIINDKKPKYLF